MVSGNTRKHSSSLPFYFTIHPIIHSIHFHNSFHHLHMPYSSIPEHNVAKESKPKTATNIRKFLRKQSCSQTAKKNKGELIKHTPGNKNTYYYIIQGIPIAQTYVLQQQRKTREELMKQTPRKARVPPMASRALPTQHLQWE